MNQINEYDIRENFYTDVSSVLMNVSRRAIIIFAELIKLTYKQFLRPVLICIAVFNSEEAMCIAICGSDNLIHNIDTSYIIYTSRFIFITLIILLRISYLIAVAN